MLFLQSLPLYTPWLFHLLLNEHIVEIGKPGICLLTFVLDEFSGLIFRSIKLFNYTFKIFMNNKWCFIRSFDIDEILIH